MPDELSVSCWKTWPQASRLSSWTNTGCRGPRTRRGASPLDFPGSLWPQSKSPHDFPLHLLLRLSRRGRVSLRMLQADDRLVRGPFR